MIEKSKCIDCGVELAFANTAPMILQIKRPRGFIGKGGFMCNSCAVKADLNKKKTVSFNNTPWRKNPQKGGW